MKNYLRAIAVLVFSSILLWLAWGQIPLTDLIDDLRQISIPPLILGMICLVITLWAKVERWAWLIDENGQVSRKALWTALCIGYLGNVVLPGRLGEPVRAYVLSHKTSVTISRAMSSIVVEKVLDIGTLLVILFGLSLSVRLPTWATWAGMVSGMAFIGLCGFLTIIVLGGESLLTRIEKFCTGLHPRWANGRWWEWLRDFVNGFAILRSSLLATRVIAGSIFSWLLGGLINLFVLTSFDITPLVPAAALTLVTTNLGMALPSAPAYVGVHHYFSTVALVDGFAVAPDLAFAYAVVVHALIFGSFALFGSIALVTSGINLSDLYKETGTRVSQRLFRTKASKTPIGLKEN